MSTTALIARIGGQRYGETAGTGAISGRPNPALQGMLRDKAARLMSNVGPLGLGAE